MAMTSCHECKAPVSTTAASCPHCGARPPKAAGNGSGIAAMVAGAFAVALVGLIYFTAGRSSPPPPKSAEQIQADRAKEARFQADAIKLRALKARLKNPASFELAAASRLSDGTLCVTYRGTNSFNAITTEQAAITPDGNLADYSTACAGKTGENIEYIRHALGR